MSDAEINQPRFFVAADDVDRKPKCPLGLRQKFARILRYPEGVGSDRAHRRRMHAGKPFAKALQASDRGLHRCGRDSAVAVESGAEAQRLAPSVLAIDLTAFDTPDFEPEAVRSGTRG